MSKCYFHVLLHSKVDKNKIWALGLVNFKLGILRLQALTLDFNPDFQKSTNAQLQIQFYLSQVFWHPQILLDLAKCVGVPLKIDDNTLAGEFENYPQVLIDVDLVSHLLNSILLNKKRGSVTIKLFYEHILDFCNARCSVGHVTSNCCWLEINNKFQIPKESTQSVVDKGKLFFHPKDVGSFDANRPKQVFVLPKASEVIISKVARQSTASSMVLDDVATANPFELLNDENVLEQNYLDGYIVNQASKASNFLYMDNGGAFCYS